MRIRSAVLAGGALALSAFLFTEEARADMFGISDAVYWVQQIAMMKSQMNSMSNQLQMAKQQLKSFGHKRSWNTIMGLIQGSRLENRYDENVGWEASLAKGTGVINTWSHAVTRIGDMSSLRSNAAYLRRLSHAELADKFGSDAISAAGNCNAMLMANEAALRKLSDDALSQSADANTQAAQQNIANGALLAQVKLQTCQQTLEIQRVKLAALDTARQREEDAQVLNEYAQSADIRTTNPSDWVGGEKTISDVELH